MTQLTTHDMRLDSANNLVERVQTVPHYVFIGNNFDPDGSNTIYDAPAWNLVDPYRNMILGKRVQSTDVCLVIRDVPWTSNTIYTMYDDQDSTLPTSNYYSTVLQGDYTHVWKCLDNNNGNPSTATPDIGDVGEYDEIYQTSDGYRWKYMFSIDSGSLSKFSVSGYVPITPNTSVQSMANTGTIDVIKVDDPGARYDNNLSGKFQSQDLRIGGNAQVYTVSSNSVSSSANGFYTGCLIYLSSGTGAGQFRKIINYFSNNSSKFIVLDSQFDEQPTNGTGWEISPEVVIEGSGTETINASARALVNAVGNTIYRVEVLSRGENYTWATASVTANASVPAINASVRVISPPRGGHGSNPGSELDCSSAVVSVTLSGSESNTIPYTGDFGQVGLTRDLVFNEVTLLVNAQGTFLTDDTISFYDSLLLQANASVTLSNDQVISSWGGFDQQVLEGSWVYVVDSTGNNWIFSTLSSVNATTLTLSNAPTWSSNTAYVYSVDITSNGTITASGGNQNVVVSLPTPIETGSKFFTSTGMGVVTGMIRSGQEKAFNTFVQATKVTGSYLSGAFVENERVWAGANTLDPVSEGYVHSIYSDGPTITLYLTRSKGEFFSAQALKGDQSGALFQVTDRTFGEVDSWSGPVLHLENLNRVTRSSSQREVFRFLFSYGD